jgi:hypothetical protein
MKRCRFFRGCVVLCCLAVALGQSRADDQVEAAANRLTVELRDGSRIVGDTDLDALTVTTEMAGTINLQLAKLTSLQQESTNSASVLTLRNGDRLRGMIQAKTLKLSTSFGRITIPVTLISKLTVSATGNMGSGMTDGLLLYYSFGTDDGRVVRDQSGHGHDGRVLGATYVTDARKGGAYRFERGVREFREGGMRFSRGIKEIRVPDSPDWAFANRPFSISLWVNFDVIPDDNGEAVMIGHDEGPGPHRKWGFEFASAGVDFHINGPDPGQGFIIAAHRFRPDVNRWYHLALTRDGATYKLYIDGKCVTTDINSAAVPDAAADLTLGNMEGLGMDGMLNEIMIFNRALSPEEIKSIFESQQ